MEEIIKNTKKINLNKPANRIRKKKLEQRAVGEKLWDTRKKVIVDNNNRPIKKLLKLALEEKAIKDQENRRIAYEMERSERNTTSSSKSSKKSSLDKDSIIFMFEKKYNGSKPNKRRMSTSESSLSSQNNGKKKSNSSTGRNSYSGNSNISDENQDFNYDIYQDQFHMKNLNIPIPLDVKVVKMNKDEKDNKFNFKQDIIPREIDRDEDKKLRRVKYYDPGNIEPSVYDGMVNKHLDKDLSKYNFKKLKGINIGDIIETIKDNIVIKGIVKNIDRQNRVYNAVISGIIDKDPTLNMEAYEFLDGNFGPGSIINYSGIRSIILDTRKEVGIVIQFEKPIDQKISFDSVTKKTKGIQVGDIVKAKTRGIIVKGIMIETVFEGEYYYKINVTELTDLKPLENADLYVFNEPINEVQSGSKVLFSGKKGRVTTIGYNGSISIRFDEPFSQKFEISKIMKTHALFI